MVNFGFFQKMFDAFYQMTGYPITIGLIDGELIGNDNGVFLGAGWQRVCTDFHKLSGASAKQCSYFDGWLTKQINKGKSHAFYTCAFGMTVVAVPIIHENRIVAKLQAGPFFKEEPDLNCFKENAREYGFEVEEYIKAVSEVNVTSAQKLEEVIKCLKAYSEVISAYFIDKKEEIFLRGNININKNFIDECEKSNEVVTSTLLALDGYIYSFDSDLCFENHSWPFKVGFFGEIYDDIIGKHYTDFVSEDFLAELKEAMVLTNSTGETTKFLFKKDKKIYHISVILRYGVIGKPIGTTMQIKEVTGEIEALYNVEKLTVASEQSPVSIMITDKFGAIEYVNEAFLNVSGYEREEIIGESIFFLKVENINEADYKRLWSAVSNGETWQGEIVNKKKDGELYWVDCRICPVYIDGKIEYYAAVKNDITEKKEMEKALHNYKNELEEKVIQRTKQLEETSQNYKNIVEHITGIVWEADLNGIIRYVSPNIFRYSDYKPEDLLGKPASYLFDPSLHSKVYELLHNLSLAPREFNDFEVFLEKGKKRTYLKASGKPIYDIEGKAIGIRGISLDHTQQKGRDKEILTAIWNAEERQKAIISMELHDSVGSSLAAASIYLNTALRKHTDDSVLSKVDQIIKDTARDVRLIARQIRPPELEKLGLEGGLNNLKQLYENNGSLSIEFKICIDDVNLHPEMELAAYRIIAELITNSVKHGEATSVEIYVFAHSKNLYVLFEDNGNGNLKVNNSEISECVGIGISNIRNRVKAFDGVCKFYPIKGVGLVVGIEMMIG